MARPWCCACGARRPREPARPCFCWARSGGLSALDLYGPYRLFRLHALCEALLFPAALHMALEFPEPVRFAHRRAAVWLPYALAAGLALIYQHGLSTPSSYVLLHLMATNALGAALLFLLLSLVARYLRPHFAAHAPAAAPTGAGSSGGTVVAGVPHAG